MHKNKTCTFQVLCHDNFFLFRGETIARDPFKYFSFSRPLLSVVGTHVKIVILISSGNEKIFTKRKSKLSKTIQRVILCDRSMFTSVVVSKVLKYKCHTHPKLELLVEFTFYLSFLR